MSAQQQRSKAVDVSADELVAAADPVAYDQLIKELVRTRESAHDRERQATAAEGQLEGSRRALQDARSALDRDITQTRKSLAEREAACAAKEGEIEQREARITAFQKQINAA